MYELIIFDIDGTMIDTESVVMKSYSYAMKEELGRDLTDEEMSRAYGIPTHKAVELLGAKSAEEASNRYFESLFKYFREGVPIFRGIVEILEELDKCGNRCGIVTSRNREEVENDTTLKELLKYFRYVVTAEDTSRHKPDPEPVLRLMDMAGAEPAGVIYIGDTYYDYMCAKNAGAKFALASWGARKNDDIKPDFVLEKPGDLLGILERE